MLCAYTFEYGVFYNGLKWFEGNEYISKYAFQTTLGWSCDYIHVYSVV